MITQTTQLSLVAAITAMEFNVHIMPPLVAMLEMDRFKMGFDPVDVENRCIHMLEALPMKHALQRALGRQATVCARVVAQMVARVCRQCSRACWAGARVGEHHEQLTVRVFKFVRTHAARLRVVDQAAAVQRICLRRRTSSECGCWR